MLLVALGALLGVYFLIRGCVLLRRKPGTSCNKPAPVAPLADAARSIPKVEASKREIIRLTPDGEPDVSTQQGKIAAALLKAGVSGPTAWSGSGNKASAILADEESVLTHEPGGLVESLNLTTSKALERAAGRPTLAPALSHGDSFETFSWKPALMIWGGPILALACIYLLAFHFGWL
jgi:hypothetical protein